jgi:hypothetical protein
MTDTIDTGTAVPELIIGTTAQAAAAAARDLGLDPNTHATTVRQALYRIEGTRRLKVRLVGPTPANPTAAIELEQLDALLDRRSAVHV